MFPNSLVSSEQWPAAPSAMWGGSTALRPISLWDARIMPTQSIFGGLRGFSKNWPLLLTVWVFWPVLVRFHTDRTAPPPHYRVRFLGGWVGVLGG